MTTSKLPGRLKDNYRMPKFLVGDLVRDDLTYEVVKVVDVLEPTENEMTGGYILDHEFLDGYRHAWEVSLPFGVWDE